jgi:hypothetical protein
VVPALFITLMDYLVMVAQALQVSLVEILQIAPRRKLLAQAAVVTPVLEQIQVLEQLVQVLRIRLQIQQSPTVLVELVEPQVEPLACAVQMALLRQLQDLVEMVEQELFRELPATLVLVPTV